MKTLLRSALGIVFLSFCLVSCKNNIPKEARYIPKDAGLVLVMDPQQMQDKLQKGGISIDSLISRIFKNDSADAKEKAMFDDMRLQAGIDWNEKIFVFISQKLNADSNNSVTMSVLGSLKDSAKFGAFTRRNEHLKNISVQKAQDFSYLLPHEGTMIAWNDKQIIVTHHSHNTKAVYDSAAMRFKPGAPVDLNSEIKEQVTRYFTQKTSESLAEVTAFTNMFKDKADGYMFTNSNSFISALNAMPFQIPKLEDLLKDNYTTATLTFETGKIVAKMTNYTNPTLSSVLKQYAGPAVDLSLVQHYPSSNIDVLWLTAFNPELIGGLLKQLEVEGLANDLLQKKIGLSSQDLYKALKGDMAVVVSDLGMSSVEPQAKTDERSMMKKKAWGKMIFIAPVGDKASFAKIMDKGVEQGLLEKRASAYMLKQPLNSFAFLVADDKNLVIASDSVTYSAYMAKTATAAINKDVLERFKGKTGAFYFDIATTLNGFTSDSTGHFNHSLVSAKQTFKDMIGTSDKFDGDAQKASFEVRMQNETQNSLVTLTSLITNIAIDMRVQAKKERESEEKMFPGGVPAIIRTN
ncbi:MAG: DUF4836 family protein [Chitinophagaceae bacterium]|nr:DUF4836 family protein [Chitinophagaceae bacterium]